MNSMYGLFGSSTGYIPCKAVAASTTAKGREMIDKTKEVVEEMGGRVIYGDTVPAPAFDSSARVQCVMQN